MEANETPKRKQRTVTKPYQKHKTDYKIVIKYKLKNFNSHLKKKDEAKEISLILCIEIRAKRQTTVIPSHLFILTTPILFEKYFEHPTIQKLIAKEKNEILNSLVTFINQKGDEFNIYRWHNVYLSQINRSRYSIKEVIGEIFKEKLLEELAKHGVEKNLYDELCGGSIQGQLIKCISLATIIQKLDAKRFQDFCDLHMTFIKEIWYRLNLEIDDLDNNSIKEHFNADLSYYFNFLDVKSGFFRDIIEEFLELNPDGMAQKALIEYEKLILEYYQTNFEHLDIKY